MTSGNAFISYRREDSAGYAGRIYDRLNARFPNRVFMDVSGLDPGVDFVEEIQKAVGSCKVLIVLIGKNWAVSSEGVPRLQDPNDFVRLEVGHALERKIRVIPILVGGATIPPADSLPPEIGALLRRQVLKLDDSAFDYNVNQLIGVLEKDLGPAETPGAGAEKKVRDESAKPPPPRQEEPRTVYAPYPPPVKKSRKWLWISAGAIAAIWFVVAVIGAIIEEFSTPIDPQATAAIFNALSNSTANPAQNAPTAPASGLNDDNVDDVNDGASSTPEPADLFNPIGRWRVSLGENAPVSLLLQFDANGSFEAKTEGAGFSYTGSQGTWTYDASRRILAATGVNNIGGFFQTIFQNIQPDGDHYHAFVPGQGNVVLTRE